MSLNNSDTPEEKDLLLWTKPRPYWHAIVAAVCFTVSIFLLYIAFYEVTFAQQYLRDGDPINIIPLLMIPIAIGLNYSVTKYVYFDLENKKYKEQFGIGRVKYGVWKKMPPLKYISIFSLDNSEFELNLWYGKNKHIEIETFWTKEEAIENGFYLARDLGIKLFDASDRNTKNKYLNMAELAIQYSNENAQEPEREN